MRLRATLGITGLFVTVLALCATGRAVAQGEPEELILTTADSVSIAAYWYERTSDAPVALLLHNTGYSHHAWQPLLISLFRNGFHVMTVDLRGHGRSKDIAPEIFERMRNRDNTPYSEMIHDAQAAIDWLIDDKGVAPERIALIGGEYGANLAIQALAQNLELRAAVALSPAHRYYNTSVMEYAEKCTQKPLYVIITKRQLSHGGQAIADLMRENDTFEMKVFPRAELRGVELLNTRWRVEQLIVEWLRKTFEL